MTSSSRYLTREQLNSTAVSIEFTVISLFQGFVLGSLVTSSMDAILTNQYQYWPYIAIGFLFILFFWAQAIIHMLSFVSWPLELYHYSLYFLAAFIEMIVFTRVTDPIGWFGYGIILFALAEIIYLYDLYLIKRRQTEYKEGTAKTLYQDMVNDQRVGLLVMVPLGVLFSFVAWRTMIANPTVYLTDQRHLIFGIIELVIALTIVGYTYHGFVKRSQLITELAPH
jgi:hypothetical protein